MWLVAVELGFGCLQCSVNLHTTMWTGIYKWLTFFFVEHVEGEFLILEQHMTWSSPHTIPQFCKHSRTSAKCHTVASSIFL